MSPSAWSTGHQGQVSSLGAFSFSKGTSGQREYPHEDKAFRRLCWKWGCHGFVLSQTFKGPSLLTMLTNVLFNHFSSWVPCHTSINTPARAVSSLCNKAAIILGGRMMETGGPSGGLLLAGLGFCKWSGGCLTAVPIAMHTHIRSLSLQE